MRQTCPALHRYVNNSYKQPPKLFLGDGTFILSKEGTTQGDNVATAMYAIGTKPLIDILHNNILDKETIQAWFADDSASAGKILGLKEWWDILKQSGPIYGYHPKPSKTYLIVKDPNKIQEALAIFGEEGVNITCEGERHIGAVIGSEAFKEKFVGNKIDTWIKDVTKLAEMAKEDPQAALVAYNIGMSKRWSFLQRTVKDTGVQFEPLESTIREKLIPALVGRQISDLERRPFLIAWVDLESRCQTKWRT